MQKFLIWFFHTFIHIKIAVIHLTIKEAKLVISGSGSENCRNPTNHVKQMAHSWKINLSFGHLSISPVTMKSNFKLRDRLC